LKGGGVLFDTGVPLMPLPPVHRVHSGDVTLACREYGAGEPLILINGLASAMDMWNPPVIEALARHFRVVVFDNRGTGYSGLSGRRQRADVPVPGPVWRDRERVFTEVMTGKKDFTGYGSGVSSFLLSGFSGGVAGAFFFPGFFFCMSCDWMMEKMVMGFLSVKLLPATC
jgi:pimeloyl-ACP methyl ester carboxylesterase